MCTKHARVGRPRKHASAEAARTPMPERPVGRGVTVANNFKLADGPSTVAHATPRRATTR
eukprot:7728320-Alexandrium_andersonii.AAC.1